MEQWKFVATRIGLFWETSRRQTMVRKRDMGLAPAVRIPRNRAGRHAFAVCCVLGLGLLLTPAAKADFVGIYAANNWTLINSVDPFGTVDNGYVLGTTDNTSITLTGGITGSGF